MKTTGPDARMIKIGPNEWVHVRGDGWQAHVNSADFAQLLKSRLDAMTSNSRILIFELVD